MKATEGKFLKVAWIRDLDAPAGKPALGHLNCPCGHAPETKYDESTGDITCACGNVYTWDGWMKEKTENPHPWYGKHSIYTDQGLIINEATGATVAVCYTSEADTLLFAAAHDLLDALIPLSAWAENERRMHNARGEDNEAAYMGSLARAAADAIAKATRNAQGELVR